MVAALTRIFGLHNLELAEDVVQDAFCRALEVWKLRGVPDNPSAWLMTTAKNRAIDVIRRERTARTTSRPSSGRLLASEWTLVPTVTERFAASAIKDDQLRMMFSCCHPRSRSRPRSRSCSISWCGFSARDGERVPEPRAAVEKRLTRAKKVLAESKAALRSRRRAICGTARRRAARALPALQRRLSRRVALRRPCAELCHEAMRLSACCSTIRFPRRPRRTRCAR